MGSQIKRVVHAQFVHQKLIVAHELDMRAAASAPITILVAGSGALHAAAVCKLGSAIKSCENHCHLWQHLWPNG